MKKNNLWIFKIIIITFILAIFMSIFADTALRNTNLFFAIGLLLIIIFIGIFFDTIGIAVASAKIEPFNSMASQKIKAAKHSIYLIKNASMVANFCNDVIGDIAGIVSGAAGAIIITKLMQYDIPFLDKSMISVVLTGIIASITVGGKAIGKIIGLNHSKKVVEKTGIIIYYFDKIFHLKIVE
jgi:CBS domain containing-hemolysin-like protein